MKLKKVVICSILLIAILLMMVMLTGCNNTEKKRIQSYAFGTYVDIVLSGKHVEESHFDIILSKLNELESIFSGDYEKYPSSDIVRYNSSQEGEKIEVSFDTYNIIGLSKEYFTMTDGAFNPSIYWLTEFWGFLSYNTGSSFKINYPTENTHLIEKILVTANMDSLKMIEENGKYFLQKTGGSVVVDGVTLNHRVDLGAIGKGYAVDVICDMVKEMGYSEGYISLGGSSIQVFGDNDGDGYKIGLVNPRKTEGEREYYANYRIEKNSISSSGDYERFFIDNDRRYSHIIGKDGYPINNGMVMATIECQSAAQGDALTTALMVLGEKKALELAERVEFGYALVVENIIGEYQVKTNIDLLNVIEKYKLSEQ